MFTVGRPWLQLLRQLVFVGVDVLRPGSQAAKGPFRNTSDDEDVVVVSEYIDGMLKRVMVVVLLGCLGLTAGVTLGTLFPRLHRAARADLA